MPITFSFPSIKRLLEAITFARSQIAGQCLADNTCHLILEPHHGGVAIRSWWKAGFSSTVMPVNVEVTVAGTSATGAAAIKGADALFKALGAFDKDAAVSLSCDPERTSGVSITAENKTVKLADIAGSPDLAPAPLAIRPGATTGLVQADILGDMIAAVIDSVSSDETRAHLNSALFVVEKKRWRIVATDGHRLSLSESLLSSPRDVQMLIIHDAFKLVEKLCYLKKASDHVSWFAGFLVHPEPESDRKREPGEIEVARFSRTTDAGDQYTVSVSTTNAVFPAYSRVMPREEDPPESVLTVEPAAFAQRIRTYSNLASGSNLPNYDRTGGVAITPGLDNQSVHLASADTDPQVLVVAPAQVEGTLKTVSFKDKYLLDALDPVKDSKATISIWGDLDPLLITSKQSPYVALKAVVMPMRLVERQKTVNEDVKTQPPKPRSKLLAPEQKAPAKPRKGKAKPAPAETTDVQEPLAPNSIMVRPESLGALASILAVRAKEQKLTVEISQDGLTARIANTQPCIGSIAAMSAGQFDKPVLVGSIETRDLELLASGFTGAVRISVSGDLDARVVLAAAVTYAYGQKAASEEPKVPAKPVEVTFSSPTERVRFLPDRNTEESFTDFDHVSSQAAAIAADPFQQMLDTALPFTVEDLSRALYGSINFVSTPTSSSMYATDGHRLVEVSTPTGSDPDFHGWIWMGNAKMLNKALKRKPEPSVVRFEQSTLWGKLYSGIGVDLPSGERLTVWSQDVSDALDVERRTELLTLSEKNTQADIDADLLQKEVKLLRKLASHIDDGIELTFEQGYVGLKWAGLSGSAKLSVPATVYGQKTTALLFGRYLWEAIDPIDSHLLLAAQAPTYTETASGERQAAYHPVHILGKIGPYIGIHTVTMPRAPRVAELEEALQVIGTEPVRPMSAPRPYSKKPQASKPKKGKAAAQPPAAVALHIDHPTALQSMATLEGQAWETAQKSDEHSLQNTFGFYTNQKAFAVLRSLGPAAEGLTVNQIEPEAGAILGEQQRLYVLMPDGEIVLLGDTATETFKRRARKILRVVDQ